MATGYGIASTLVTSDLVNQVKLGGYDTIVSAETGNIGPNGGYQVKTEYPTFNCSNSGVFVELLDTIPWTNITYEILTTGASACWTFNRTGYGPTPTDGNMASYNESLGDRVSRPKNSWEVAAFQSHAKDYACDNNSNNFHHGNFQVGNPKTFFMQRRRNVNGSLAGPHVGKACTGAGTTMIRNIRIW